MTSRHDDGVHPPQRQSPARRSAFARALLSPQGLMVVVLLAGVAWRVGRYAARRPLWGDEGFVAVNLLDRDFADMLRPPLEHGQVVSIGFLWSELAVTKVLGLSEWALHLLPMLSGLAAFLLTWRLAAEALDRRTALLGMAVLAAAYYPVRHGVEVKPYAGDMAAAVALMYLAWRLKQRPGSVGLWVALTALGAAAVWLSLPAAFVVGGVAIFLGWHSLATRRPRQFVPLAIFAVVATASFAWMYQVFAGPTARANLWYWAIPTWKESFPPLDRPWLIPWWLVRVHAGNMMAYPVGGNHLGSTATLLVVIAGSASLWRRRRRDLVILLLSPLLPALAAAAMQKYPYGTSARVMLFMAPSFCLLAGAGLMAIFRRFVPIPARTTAVRIAVAALVIWALGGLASDIIWPYKRASNLSARQTTQAIAAKFSPDDQVLIANAKDYGQFLPHFEGPDCAPIWFYMHTFSRAAVRWTVPPEQVRPVAGDTWVVYYETPRSSEPGGMEQRQGQLQLYLRQLTERLGQPSLEEYELLRPYKHRGPGRLSVYRFPPAREPPGR
ncbi:MAG: glycosyltransferase family 39 protein [Phycisphaerae bacterium]|nr:glycosyltransferase family 39 protein [Phycisphaerae bacterium]